jgi:hypothetical protein
VKKVIVIGKIARKKLKAIDEARDDNEPFTIPLTKNTPTS